MLSLASKQAAVKGRHIVKALATSGYATNKDGQIESWLLVTRKNDGMTDTQRSIVSRSLHTTRSRLAPTKLDDDNKKPLAPVDMVSHNFPDFIEHWNRAMFHKVGYGLTAATAMSLATSVAISASLVPPLALGLLTAGYWRIGLQDIQQSTHTLSRNYPVLGHVRYIFEVIRPELRQYIVESDTDGRPFDRNNRSQVYRRAKNVGTCLSFSLYTRQQQVNRSRSITLFFYIRMSPPPPTKTTSSHMFALFCHRLHKHYTRYTIQTR
jgi:hypothetical protein